MHNIYSVNKSTLIKLDEKYSDISETVPSIHRATVKCQC